MDSDYVLDGRALRGIASAAHRNPFVYGLKGRDGPCREHAVPARRDRFADAYFDGPNSRIVMSLYQASLGGPP